MRTNKSKWIICEIRCPYCLEYFQTECYSDEELKNCPVCKASMIEPETLIDKCGPVFEQIAETATNFFEDETISGLLEEGEE